MRTRSFVRTVIAVLLLAAAPALGQGTSQNFPDPMDHDEVVALVGPLRLSQAQLENVDQHHEAYLVAFRGLRDGRINAYLADAAHGWERHNADRDEIVESLRTQASILDEIRQLDEAFFEALRPALTDEQAELLPRIIARRERRRLEIDPSMTHWEMPELSRLDVARLLAEGGDRDLTDAEREAVDPLVAAYEAAITPIYRRVHLERRDLPVALHDATRGRQEALEQRLEELQARFDLETPDGQERFAEAIREELSHEPFGFSPTDLPEQNKVRDDIARISRLGRQLLNDLRALLDEATADRLASRYFERAYGNLGIPRDPLRRRVARFVARDGVEDDLREAVEALYADYRNDHRSMVTRMVSAAEDRSFTDNRFMWYGNQPREESPVADARRDLKDLNERSLRKYESITGEDVGTTHGNRTFTLDDGGEGVTIELADGGDGAFIGDLSFDGDAEAVEGATFDVVILDAGDGEHVGGFTSMTVVGAIDDSADILDDAADAPAGGRVHVRRGWLPGPIPEHDVGEMVRRLDAPDELRVVVEQFADDYRAAYIALDQERLRPARERLGQAGRPFGQEKQPSAAEISSAFGEVRAAMQATRDADAAFFDDLAMVFDDDASRAEIDRARRARKREAHNTVGRSGGIMMMGLPSGSREGETDLAALVASLDLEAADRDAASATLDAYDGAATTLFVERWNRELAAAEAQARQMAEAMSRRSDGDGGGMLSFAYAPPEDDGTHAARATARTELATLNQRTLAALADDVSDTAYATIHDAYQRQAFPRIFRDRKRVDEHFERALGLELPDGERQRVSLMWAEYRAEYQLISDRMIERTRAFESEHAASPPGMHGPETFAVFEAFNHEVEKDRFERENLNQRTRRRLLDSLDESSRAALGVKE